MIAGWLRGKQLTGVFEEGVEAAIGELWVEEVSGEHGVVGELTRSPEGLVPII